MTNWECFIVGANQAAESIHDLWIRIKIALRKSARIAGLRYFIFPLLFAIAWWITSGFIYYYSTSGGGSYYQSIRPITKTVTWVTASDITFIERSDYEAGSCELKASVGAPTPRIVWTAKSQLGPDGLILEVVPNPFLLDSVQRFGPLKTFPLVSFKSYGAFFSHNMGVSFDRPKGPLRAELSALATQLSGQKSSHLKAEEAQEIALTTTNEIDSCNGLTSWGHRYYWLRLISGPVEQLIVVLSVFCMLVFAFEISLSILGFSTVLFAISATETVVDLVPYVGFLGTIFGMGEALWVLGGIDISNSLQKATLIGPITGEISMAMKTSQLGIIFFLGASLLVRILKIALRRP
ncbi:MotA/TolQ/ExbB proton channel family protein [Rhizobium sp. WSM4643]|uniref:MotA/TolQ/ExbB proton channel family protein n=1 Tax=Rhizobium sp. WSM4643 TaxID=3138253 RepID=UPI0021A91759|nr:MotA/TolQ/ExbB proton channel family protein [Rhizobium leguminosarum]UWM75849.1 MotA/TolQ/ExbB proton channel family protein [Rhizobium leguminosarum bv. viciae]